MAEELVLDVDFDISEAEAKQRKLNAQWEQQKYKIDEIKKKISDTTAEVQALKEKQAALRDEEQKTVEKAAELEKIIERINTGKVSPQEYIDLGGIENVSNQYSETLAKVKQIEQLYDKNEKTLMRCEGTLAKSNVDLGIERSNLDMIGSKIKEINLGTDKHNQKWESIKSAIANANKPFDAFTRRIMGLAKRVFVFSVITKALRAIRTTVGEMISADAVLGKKLSALKLNLSTMGMTVYQSLKPYIEWIIDKMIYITRLSTVMLAKLLGKDVNQMAQMATNTGKLADNTRKAANAAKKATASFDTLQTLSFQNTNASATNSDVNADFGNSDISNYDKIIEKLKQILTYVLAIGAGFLTWKIIGGKVGAGLGFIVSGILLIISGVKDWIKNGESLGAVLKIVFGIMSVGIGAAILGFGGMAVAVAGFISMVLLIGTQWDKIQAMIKKSPVWFQETFGRIATILLWPFKNIYDVWKGVIKGILQIAKGDLLGGLKTIFYSIVRLIANSLNLIIDSINGTLLPVRGVIWAIGKAAGQKWKMSDIAIPHIPVPKLATGAVIPGGKPFMAMLGDQKAGQTNIEAPLDTIVDAVKLAIGEPKFTIEATGSMSQFIRMLNLKIKQEQNRSSAF